MILKGRAHKYGDHVNTDVIIPARYLNVSDADQLAAHCMEDLDAEFVKRVQPGDVMIGGEDFGCGSSREHAPMAIKASGVSAVIARSFARIFFRNAINIGLPVLVSPQAAAEIEAGDDVQIDLTSGTISDVTRGKTYQAQPFPEFLQDIISAGGLIPYTRRRLGIGTTED
ncbi:MAG: 3-isopropylmalate dehydratase small subunit [Armatimonadota bacterium]|nr:MAG: 3-isopropylmalate dehydratase small subunit [Armatimonadota bacterium]